VPWGELAGREWGEAAGAPWMALHDWLDNCGTFAPLAALLPPGLHLLALDLPGHGRSSHLPPGQAYHYLDHLAHVARVARYMGWESFGLLGHSMGAGIASLYAATFPDQVRALVMLDLIKPTSRRVEEVVELTRAGVQGGLHLQQNTRPEKVYPTYEAALERLMDNLKIVNLLKDTDEEKSMERVEASARVLLERGLVEVEGGWRFTRDRRLQLPPTHGLGPDTLLELAAAIACPHLLIKAQSPAWDSEELNRAVLAAYSRNPLHQHQAVPGPHHVHLLHPEVVAGPVRSFLAQNDLLT